MQAATVATTRDATLDDVPALADMGLRFIVEWAGLRGTHKGIAAGIENLIRNGGFARLLEKDGQPFGMLLGVLTPKWYDQTQLIAVEFAWWLEESARHSGNGLRLWGEFEAWGKAQGASSFAGSDLMRADSPADLIFQSLGYRAIERSWVKEL